MNSRKFYANYRLGTSEGKLPGAVRYYNEVVNLAPDTVYAEEALKKIDELKPLYEAETESGVTPQ